MRAIDFYNYKIYEDGSIYNHKGTSISKRVHHGRYEVRLVCDGIRKNFLLHRLMYKYFVKDFNMEDKNLCVVTKDGNFLNLDLDNLQLKHRKDLIQGDNHKSSKLDNLTVEKIREEYIGKSGANQFDKKTLSYKDLAKKYGVSKGEIALLVKGRTRNKNNYKL